MVRCKAILGASSVLSRSSFESQEVVDFMKVLNNRPDEGTVLSYWQKVVARADSHVLSRDFSSLGVGDRILAGRSAAPAVYVDYADQYYVNAKVPWLAVPMWTLRSQPMDHSRSVRASANPNTSDNT